MSLPAGTFVLPAIAALHYREDLFPEPQEFRPERFLEGKADNYAWIPFGGGVRRCIGAAFAEYEMRIVLRTFLERAELSAPDPRPEKVKVRNITLAPGRGARVRPRPAAALSLIGRRAHLGLGLLPALEELRHRAFRLRMTPFRALGLLRGRPDAGVRELLLELAQLRFGMLDLLGEPARARAPPSATGLAEL